MHRCQAVQALPASDCVTAEVLENV